MCRSSSCLSCCAAVPWGFYETLLWVHSRYSLSTPSSPPIYITENGCDVKNESIYTLQEVVKDVFRQQYFQGYLHQMERAILAGVPIKGTVKPWLLDHYLHLFLIYLHAIHFFFSKATSLGVYLITSSGSTAMTSALDCSTSTSVIQIAHEHLKIVQVRVYIVVPSLCCLVCVTTYCLH